MALNYPGPWTVKIFYTHSGLEHVLQLNTTVLGSPVPGTLFADMDIDDDILGSVGLDTAVDDLVTLMRPMFNTGTDITRAELWKNIPDSFEAQYWSSYAINLAGTSANPAILAGQVIFTFRTYEGGIMKIYLQEAYHSPGASLVYADAYAVEKAFIDHFVSGAQRWIARDTSAPFVFLKVHPGQSEALFKKRYR